MCSNPQCLKEKNNEVKFSQYEKNKIDKDHFKKKKKKKKNHKKREKKSCTKTL
jgi:hypothetical protein